MKKEFKATLTVLLCVAMLLSALLGCSQQHKEDDEDPPRKDKVTTTASETTSPTTTKIQSVDTTTVTCTTSAQPEVPVTPQKIEIDLITPFLDCIWYDGPNGQGTLNFGFEKEQLGSIDLKFGDYYFVPDDYYINLGYYLKVVYQNEKVGIVEFDLPDDRNLKKGDVISIKAHWNYNTHQDVEDTFELLPKEVVVPDLGDYVTQSTEITSGVIDRIMDVASYHFASEHEEASLLATYTLDLKPGYTKDYISSEKSNRAIALIFKYSEETFSGQKYIAYNILWLTDLVYVSAEHPNVHYSYNAECVKRWLKEFESFEEAEAYLNQEYNTSCQISKIS